MKKAKLLLLCFCVLLISEKSAAQIVDSGDFTDYMEALIDQLPGRDSEEFTIPNFTDRGNFLNAIEQVINEDYAGANTTLSLVNYELIEFTDLGSNKVYHIAKNQAGVGKHWGIYVFNENATRRKLFFQSPHSLFDGAGYAAVHIYEGTNAYVIALSGTHRCNTAAKSGCDGSTGVCNTTGFQESDAAHSTENMFYQITEKLDALLPSLLHIQLHGFGRDTGEPSAYLSNGSLDSPVGTDYLDLFRTKLLLQDGGLSADVAHIDQQTSLSGRTNVTGRLVNGSNSSCDQRARVNSGRFFHIEQEKPLRETATGWNKVMAAFVAAFPEDTPNQTEVYIKSENYATVVTEGSDASFEIVVSIENPSMTNSTTVDVEIVGDDSDFGGYSTQQVVFAAGQTDDQVVVIPLVDDLVQEPTRIVHFKLTNPTGGNAAMTQFANSAIVQVIDDEPILIQVIITEIHMDPKFDIGGDANGDGFRSSSEDEFVEILNTSESEVDLEGFEIWDADKMRHVFPAGTVLQANEAVVVFGGGTPTGDFGGSLVQVASSGSLSATNSGDDFRLKSSIGVIYNEFIYKQEGMEDQSLTLSGPDFVSPHQKHLDVSSVRFSPGTDIDGSSFLVEPLPLLMLNEFQSDPASDISGDANGDGVRHFSDDEFLELLNIGDAPADLSGYKIYDNFSVHKLRHVFPNGTVLQPDHALVVFGGGSPDVNAFGPGTIVQTASTGGLGLTNGSETVEIETPGGETILSYQWGSEGGVDQSLTRYPDGDINSSFQSHSDIPQAAGALYSPGRKVDGTDFQEISISELSISTLNHSTEGSGDGLFSIDISPAFSQPTSISIEITGTASNGSDYSSISTNILLLVDQDFVTIPVTLINDNLVEGDEEVTVKLLSTDQAAVIVGAQDEATLTITDDDVAQLSVIVSNNASEDSNDGLITVSTDKQFTSSVDVTLSISGSASMGSDYSTIPLNINFPAHTDFIEIPVEVIGDNLVEGDETVIITMLSTDHSEVSIGTSNQATVTISDDDVATLSIAATTQAAEDDTKGVFTITTDKQFTSATEVLIGVSGTASSDVDYTAISSSVIFPANTSTTTISVNVIGDGIEEEDETVIVTMLGTNKPNVLIGESDEATITIADDDDPTPVINLIINELHVDPKSGLAGDANGDGTRHATDDEFVEIVNHSANAIDLDGYELWDSKSKRHEFTSTVPAGEAIVVFGGGNPTGNFGNAIVVTASTGGVSLTNGGDAAELKDPQGNTVAFYAYGGEFNINQSVTKDPDITGLTFEPHSTTIGSGGALYSPGTRIDGTPFTGAMADPMEENQEIGQSPLTVEIDAQILLYPNPVSIDANQLKIRGLNHEEDVTFNLFDLNGKTIISQSVPEDETILLHGIAKVGIYYYRLVSRKGLIHSGKIRFQ